MQLLLLWYMTWQRCVQGIRGSARDVEVISAAKKQACHEIHVGTCLVLYGTPCIY